MELVNTIDNKELFAARSVADAEGNTIVDTYAKKEEIPSVDGFMEESKLTISEGKITEYDGTPFAGQDSSSDLVHFDYNNGNPELSWSEIKAYMDIGKQIIIYDKTVSTDGKTKLGYVSNYDKVNNFIQFTNVSNMVVEGETVNGINWAYVGNSLGWQRTFIRNGGSGGKTYEGVAPIIVDNNNDTISADTIELETKEVTYQQITHDDSLVHVSNDAQYALGVNTNWLVTYLLEQGFVKN